MVDPIVGRGRIAHDRRPTCAMTDLFVTPFTPTLGAGGRVGTYGAVPEDRRDSTLYVEAR
jgi:hypothetical protein